MREHDLLLFLSAITMTEIEAGILKLTREHKDARAGQLAVLRDSLMADFGERLLPLDVAVALAVAHLAEAAKPMVIELTDLIVAATARVHGFTVLTRNIKHFAPTGVGAIDPVHALPRA